MQHVKIHGWNAIRYNAGEVSLVVIPDLGGRIISLTVGDQELLFVQKDHEGETFDFSNVCDLRHEKQKLGFRVWGGDKTWIAQEKDWWEKIPPLELDAGRYQWQMSPHQIKMISPVCRETGLQITRTVALKEDGTILLDQKITNKGKDSIRKGIWNVTQLLRPCDVCIPAKKEDIRSYHTEDPTLPNHSIVPSQTGDLVRIPCRDNQLFKFGGIPNQGHMLCLCDAADGKVALLKNFYFDANAPYLHRSAVEVFNAKDHNYLEVEVHAPAATLKPGESASHSQQWRLKRYAKTAGPEEIYEDLTGNHTYDENHLS